MTYNEIKDAINMYTDLLKNLDTVEDSKTINFCKSELERLKEELHKLENLDSENIKAMIALYHNELNNSELEPDKRNFYLSEMKRLEDILLNQNSSHTR